MGRLQGILEAKPDMGSRVRALVLLGTLLLTCASPPSGADQLPAGWPTFAGNTQHTGLAQTPAQSLGVIHWSTARRRGSAERDDPDPLRLARRDAGQHGDRARQD